MTNEQKPSEAASAKLHNLLAGIVVIAVLFVASVFIAYFANFHGDFSNVNTDWGTFGDFIGGTLNPILSFLGLIALLLTIVLQSKELESTRIQLERAASAQEKTEKVLAEQSKTQVKQQFENTFFSLLEQHNKALEKLEVREVSNALSLSSLSDLQKVRAAIFSKGSIGMDVAREMLEKQNHICGHYFRVLYQLLKFVATNCPGGAVVRFDSDDIQNAPVSPDEKMYSNIVRSFLGYDITQLLAVNCCCADQKDSYWKFKLLIERYSFLEHMPFEINGSENPLLIASKNIYSSRAFGSSDFI